MQYTLACKLNIETYQRTHNGEKPCECNEVIMHVVVFEGMREFLLVRNTMNPINAIKPYTPNTFFPTE